MSGITIIFISAVVLVIGYLGYGRWLAGTWGIDRSALTPAVRKEDGQNYTPASRFAVYSHQFSSICGAGPVTGPIIASMFGWLPVLLWVLVGGIFFGAVHDFGSLYASVKNNGKSLGQLVEKYIGKTGRRLFLLFCWLFTLLVIAAFTDMVAGTFKMTVASDTVTAAAAATATFAAGSAGTISILFTFAAILFGLFSRRMRVGGWRQFVLAVALLFVMFAVGMQFPIAADKNAWIAIVVVYLVFAVLCPINVLKTPRDYLTTIMLIAMIGGGIVGIVALGAEGQANMTIPAVASSDSLAALGAKGKYLWPLLFVTVACGAVSGFHSLVSSETSSKQISGEADMLPVGYGAMLTESFVAVISIVCAGIMAGAATPMTTTDYTPFQIFSAAIAQGMGIIGLNATFANVFMTMCVSALALTSLDAVARIGRLSFQELFLDGRSSADELSPVQGVLCNKYVATAATLVPGLVLTFGGYNNIWPLFGATNQLLSAMCLITLTVFCKCTGRRGWTLYVPVAFMLVTTFTSLFQSAASCLAAVQAQGAAVMLTSGLQLFFAILLMILGAIVTYSSLRELFAKGAGSIPDEEPEWSEQGRSNAAAREGEAAGAAEANA